MSRLISGSAYVIVFSFIRGTLGNDASPEGKVLVARTAGGSLMQLLEIEFAYFGIRS